MEAAEFEAEQPARDLSGPPKLVVSVAAVAVLVAVAAAVAAGRDGGDPAALPLLATDVGRRTLVVGDRLVPLFTEGGTPAHLVLTVRR